MYLLALVSKKVSARFGRRGDGDYNYRFRDGYASFSDDLPDAHDTNDYLIAAWLEENAVDALAKRCESHTQSTKTTQSTKKKCLQNLTT